MEHISHDCSEAWLRNVQAGQAIELCSVPLGRMVVREAEEDKTDEGSEDERCCDKTELTGIGTAVRGTPHKLQIRAAAGLRPGGLR